MKRWVWLLGLWACDPTFDLRPSLIAGPRILAVRAVPPDVVPGRSVWLEALIADPDEGPLAPEVSWAFCAAPKPLTENNIVSTDCSRSADGMALLPIGSGVTVTATVPPEACAWFGPETPGAGLRPRDPDSTGGYYQPVRLRGHGPDAFGLVRISCFLAQAPARVARAFREGYVPNENPTGLAMEGPVTAGPGERVELKVRWASGAQQRYLWFDPEAQSLVERTEVLQVSWFASAGRFDTDQTGADVESCNVWQAPSDVGVVRMWVVLRDSRGGVDFMEYRIRVTRP